MVFKIIGFDRFESASAHMQCDEFLLNTFFGEFLQEFRCKVEAGRGGGHAAAIFCVHGLILFRFGGGVFDVRRERHFADGVDDFLRGFGRGVELKETRAVGLDGLDRGP